MASGTYKQIASATVQSDTSSITFSSITSDYRDLLVVASGTSSANGYLGLRFNSDSTLYVEINLINNGSTIEVNKADRDGARAGLGPDQSTSIWNVLDYTATDKHKVIISQGSFGTSSAMFSGTRWKSLDAVNSVQAVGLNGMLIKAGTTIAIYGIGA